MFGQVKNRLECKATGEIVYGYVSYDRNNWVINDEKKDYDQYRILLKNDVPMWALVMVKHCVTGERRLAGITGEQQWGSGYTVSYSGCQGCIHAEEIEAILDRDFYLHSPIWNVAKFYQEWKAKDKMICPTCKTSFNYEGWDCWDCKHSKYEKPFDHDMFEHIELTDEMVKKHNAEVIFKVYKKWMEHNSGYEFYQQHGTYKGYLSSSFPEDMMERGAKLKDYYDILSADQIHELREIFKVTYSFCVNELKKRSEEKRNHVGVKVG